MTYTIKITCECGKEHVVPINKSIASKALSSGRKLVDPKLLSEYGKKGAAMRHKKII